MRKLLLYILLIAFLCSSCSTPEVRPQVNLSMKELRFLSTPTAGHALWMEASVENLADEFYGPLYMYARTENGRVTLVGIQGASLPAARTSIVSFSYTPAVVGTYTLLVSTSYSKTEQGDIILDQDKVIGSTQVTVAENPGAATLEVTDFAFETDSIQPTFEYEGQLYNFSHYVAEGMFSCIFHVKNTSNAPFDGSLAIVFLATDNLGTSFVAGGGIGLLQGVEIPEYVHIDANSEQDVRFALPGMLPMNWYYVPVLFNNETGAMLTNPQEFLNPQESQNARLIAQVIPGIVTFDVNGDVKTAPVEETMTFDANTIAAYVTTNAVKSVDAKNPNTLFFFDKEKAAPAAFTKNVIFGTQAASLEITDGYPFNSPYAFTAKNVSYTRTFTPRLTKEGAGWDIICVPFDVQRVESNGQALDWYRTGDAEDNAKFRLVELDEEEGQNLIFKPASEMKSNSAYLIGFPVEGGTEQKAVTFYGTDFEISEATTTPKEYTGANFVLHY